MQANLKDRDHATVAVTNDLQRVLDEAQARVKAVYAQGSRSLIACMSAADWNSWDEIDDLALIADPHPLDLPDPIDTIDVPEPKAA